MIDGLGLDIVELSTVLALFKDGTAPRFARFVLTDEELSTLNEFTQEHRRAEWLAGRFALKEAVSKALGTGLGRFLDFRDIHISTDDYGKPIVRVPRLPGRTFTVSLTHTNNVACAVCIMESSNRQSSAE